MRSTECNPPHNTVEHGNTVTPLPGSGTTSFQARKAGRKKAQARGGGGRFTLADLEDVPAWRESKARYWVLVLVVYYHSDCHGLGESRGCPAETKKDKSNP